MRILNHIVYVILFLTVSLFSCERSTDWDISPDSEVRLVVEALLTDQDEIQRVKLTSSYNQLNTESPAINDALISVRVNTTSYVFDRDLNNPGWYNSRIPFKVFSGLPYSLSINWDGNEYQAVSQLSSVTVMPDILFAPYKNTDSVEIDEHAIPLFSVSQQSMYRFDIDWSAIEPQGPNQMRLYQYTFDKIHSSQFIPPDAVPAPMPKGAEVIVTKYGLDDGFAEFLRAQVIETDWNGAVLYGNAENAISNISNDAIGYFATCAILRDTLTAQ